MIRTFFLINIFLLGSWFLQNEPKLEYPGDIHYLTQTKNFIGFATRTNDNKNYIYLLDKEGNKKLEKQFDEELSDLIICETKEKLLVQFNDHKMHGEAYINKLINIKTGEEEDMLDLFTKLKLAKGGQYLYSSSHLFENASPLNIYNIETKEPFIIELQDWIRVTSISKNRLVILQQLSERNKKKLKYEEELGEKRKIFLKESHLNKIKYEKGEISTLRFFAIEDSLKEEYKSFKSKAPRGTWTQMGTRMWIYDVDSKTFIFNTELKDDHGNIIILDRDDDNSYSLTVDEDNNIYIFGSKRSNNTHREKENMFLKYDDKFNLVWAQNVENFSTPTREEYLETVHFSFLDLKTREKKSLNKNTGQIDIYEQIIPLNKKVLRIGDIKNQNNFIFDQLKFDLQNRIIYLIDGAKN